MQSILYFLNAERRVCLANESGETEQELVCFANQLHGDPAGWVQLAPYGDFPNLDGRGREVIQRFQRPEADAMVKEFRGLLNLPQRLLGLPWYVGHPDHPRFRGQPGHTDTAAKGRIKALEARADGLYAQVKFNSEGRQLLEDEAFHGHSVNWTAVPAGKEGGKQIYRPCGLKSVGFTNQPQIPVRPASLANEGDEEEAETEADKEGAEEPRPRADKVERKENCPVPARLKELAGWADDDEVTMEGVIAALEKALGELANEAAEELVTAQAETTRLLGALANERQARATELVRSLVRAGRVTAAQREEKIAALLRAGDDYETLALALANAAPVVKTAARTGRLGRQNAALQQDAHGRQMKVEQLLTQRERDFPNESYEERFAAVASSAEGLPVFAQMRRAGAEE